MREDRWTLYDGPALDPIASITLPGDVAWRLFTKGVTADAARDHARIEGDARFADPVLGTIAIIV